MYLIPILVPIYTDGERRLVTSIWRQSLLLLRDSLGGRFGTIRVLAPRLPAGGDAPGDLVELDADRDDVDLAPTFDARGRSRAYWLRQRGPYRARLREEVARADVVHGGLDVLFRPVGWEGFREGVRQGKPTIFVQDTDTVLQIREMIRSRGLAERAKMTAYVHLYERLCRRGVAEADLSLLKGRSLMGRYARFARNARNFHNTLYLSGDVVAPEVVDERLTALRRGRALRLVYCGRLVARKGVDHAVRAVALARRAGADVDLDLIGDGPDRDALAALAASLGAADHVRLLGQVPYGPELIRTLAGYDALFFTPLAEDTPRMIFDGYAAGLPLVAYDIEYVKERADEESATLPLTRDDVEGAAARLAALARDPEPLARLARAAREAGLYHAADNWYRRRAEWTFEAVERRLQPAR